MKKKLSKKKLIVFGLDLLFLGLLIFSSIKIITYLLNNKENRKIKKITENAIKINEQDNSYTVDFKELKLLNSDTVAYLKINNTNINYVVVKGKDNDYYLNHNFDKKYNVSGWIFADYKNRFDETDKNIVIYGHSTMDGSMFGTLKNVLEKSWQENEKNHIITLITEKNTYEYKVFSSYIFDPEDYYIRTDFTSDSDYLEFLNTIKSRSNYDYGVDLKIEDKILTLSSCNLTGSKRVVLHAKLINSVN